MTLLKYRKILRIGLCGIGILTLFYLLSSRV